MFETCKYSQVPIPQVKPQTSSFLVCDLLQNIFPCLCFASKYISKRTTTIFYRFRDHFPCYGGDVDDGPLIFERNFLFVLRQRQKQMAASVT